MSVNYWRAERQPSLRACEACKASPDRQVLEGHDGCLPPIDGRFTADCVPVTVGLRVWDYDLRPGTVTEVDHSFQGTPDGPLGIVAWHLVRADEGRTGMFDGSRMCTVHPVTKEHPPPLTEVVRCTAPADLCPEGPWPHSYQPGLCMQVQDDDYGQ